jgi:hypothetical protein
VVTPLEAVQPALAVDELLNELETAVIADPKSTDGIVALKTA